MKKLLWVMAIAATVIVSSGCQTASSLDVPAFDHVVVVIEENHSAAEVTSAPYISSLMNQGLLLSNSHGVTHPSEPNYIALFSGSQHGVTDDGHYDITADNLCTSLIAAGYSFGGYSEGLPYSGFRGDTAGTYARKHVPWACFTSTPDTVNMPFSSFPTDFSSLPAVSFVIPNLDDDMHDGSVEAGDSWLSANMDAYAQWAKSHNSLLVLTFDECNGSAPVATTPILTLMVGAHVVGGSTYAGFFDHYSLLRTIEAMFDLPAIGIDAARRPLSGVWR
ncbi:MAG TPA: alkaline phosphatase family protein [Spirochaetia bacterium]|nr:alkaline phosphatase family protein [Spirochaetia bacterium]